MRALRLNDQQTYTGVAGCAIVEIPDLLRDTQHEEAAIQAAGDARDCDEVLEQAAEDGIDTGHSQITVVYAFHGDEDAYPNLTGAERELVVEGLNYLEENGAPGMGWRGGTKKMEAALESITRKLGL